MTFNWRLWFGKVVFYLLAVVLNLASVVPIYGWLNWWPLTEAPLLRVAAAVFSSSVLNNVFFEVALEVRRREWFQRLREKLEWRCQEMLETERTLLTLALLSPAWLLPNSLLYVLADWPHLLN